MSALWVRNATATASAQVCWMRGPNVLSADCVQAGLDTAAHMVLRGSAGRSGSNRSARGNMGRVSATVKHTSLADLLFQFTAVLTSVDGAIQHFSDAIRSAALLFLHA